MESDENVVTPEVVAVNLWALFERNDTGTESRCKKCSKVLRMTNKGTSGLHEHANRIHKIKTIKSVTKSATHGMHKNYKYFEMMT